jgi:murein tripeptide amidase MpaA
MSNTYVDVSSTTSSNVKRSTDTDVNGSNTVNNAIYSGNFDTDLVYGEEEAPQNSNNIDTDSSLESYDHLHVYDKRETMLSIAAMHAPQGVVINTVSVFPLGSTHS